MFFFQCGIILQTVFYLDIILSRALLRLSDIMQVFHPLSPDISGRQQTYHPSNMNVCSPTNYSVFTLYPITTKTCGEMQMFYCIISFHTIKGHSPDPTHANLIFRDLMVCIWVPLPHCSAQFFVSHSWVVFLPAPHLCYGFWLDKSEDAIFFVFPFQ